MARRRDIADIEKPAKKQPRQGHLKNCQKSKIAKESKLGKEAVST